MAAGVNTEAGLVVRLQSMLYTISDLLENPIRFKSRFPTLGSLLWCRVFPPHLQRSPPTPPPDCRAVRFHTANFSLGWPLHLPHPRLTPCLLPRRSLGIGHAVQPRCRSQLPHHRCCSKRVPVCGRCRCVLLLHPSIVGGDRWLGLASTLCFGGVSWGFSWGFSCG
jgi:hypothetical protein